MNQTLNQLLSTLDEEARRYREMQTILAREKAAATLSDRERFVRVGQEKEALVHTLQQMESKRKSLVDALAKEYEIHQRPLTVSILARFLDNRQASRLLDRARHLKSLIKTVQMENSANAKLFGHYLALIHGSLSLLNELIYGSSVYQKPGTGQQVSGCDGRRGMVFCGTV